MNVSTDDLIYKIGVLTVENDLLRKVNEHQSDVIRKVTEERDALRAVRTDSESDIEKVSDEETSR